MMRRRLNALAFLLLLAFLATQSVFMLSAGEQGVMLRFGRIADADVGPGVHLRIPLADVLYRVDMRLQASDSGRTEYLVAGGDALMADAYVVWQVQDARQYWLATGADMHRAEMLLLPPVREALRQRFAAAARPQALAGLDPAVLRAMTQEVDATARRELGVHVLEIGVRSTALPGAVQEAVLRRMQAERESVAAALRAEGQARAADIRRKAGDAQSALLADAWREAERRRGEGDAEAATVAARAYAGDPGFYRFYRALQAYRNGFAKPDDVMVLRSDSEFLRFMKKPAQ